MLLKIRRFIEDVQMQYDIHNSPYTVHEIKTKLLENIEDVKHTVDISFHIDRSTPDISAFCLSLFS